MLDRLYQVGLGRRQARQRRGQKKLPIPVVSVGNLTVGGTGKTPFTVWLARHLQQMGHRVGVASRGYPLKLTRPLVVAPGADPAQVSDEGALLAQLLAGVAQVVVGPDRFAGGQLLREEKKITVLVLDDGFQHLWLHRDLDLVLLDSQQPFGPNARLLPYGRLREPPAALGRVHGFVFTGAGGLEEGARQALFNRFAPWNVRAPLSAGDVTVTGAAHWQGPEQSLPLAALPGQRVMLVSAIANPRRFVSTARAQGLEVAGHHAFRDHHAFTAADKQKLEQAAGDLPLLCTQKDLVKLAPLGPWRCPLFALCIEWGFTAGEGGLAALLQQIKPG